ncbi:hydantoinase/oxoprolinase family protein [Virgibacillus pantothenticus]|uniref:hydantoinase/oxoprolinase family protein n=1 Tax=Virgibacillus pantothenticus TaxID=1473 RepID=UPI0025B049E4|nr:hydantoinase/oxoprolinase family protein [Virgibacillus pantothenticus]
MDKQVRIGIDVGGTYTDGIVIDNHSGEIIAKEKVLTTHYSKAGVAAGITQILNKIMTENNISPQEVVFIAHGTTQATNALLEGDVAPVGIIGIGESKRAEQETRIENIELAQGRYLRVSHEFIHLKDLNNHTINEAIDKLIEAGAQVIVASAAYSVENPEYELQVIECAKERGLYATSGHEISELYGLRVRTRTSVINASLIPKMMETAYMTETVIKEVGIKSELMIMRADGGVMSLKEVRKRPILTMLSGLAAGVAGALMYGKITEGIFLEIGGTSIDISVIKDGKVMVKNASVGNYKTYIKSLDIRTLAIAGGTMVRVNDNEIVDVGPRSAHLAKKDYECFISKTPHEIKVKHISPMKDDPGDYVIAEIEDGSTYAFTLAGAANALGIIPEDDYAYASGQNARLFWKELGKKYGKTSKEMATEVLKRASEKVWATIEDLIEEYELDKDFLTLIGGGGSASVLTTFLAKQNGVKYDIIENAPYISTIGVAMAMVRERIERSVVNPNTDDIKKIRNDILNKIVSMGALEETVEISVEVDTQKHILITTAMGATEFKQQDLFTIKLAEEEIQSKVAEAMGVDTSNLVKVGEAGNFYGYSVEMKSKGWLHLFNKKKKIIVIVNDEGVILQRKTDSFIAVTTKGELRETLKNLTEEHSSYSVSGQNIPSVYLYCKGRTFDYSGLVSVRQILPIIDIDFNYMENNEKVMILLVKK